MGLIFRTSSAANIGLSSIKNAPLTYQEGDGNFAYLLTNMSGSAITIEGATTITGSLALIGTASFFNGVTIYDQNTLQSSTIYASGSNLILTGSLYGTASWARSASNAASAAYAPIPTLQQVTTTGNLTTNDIYIQGEGIFFGNQGINLYAGTSGFPGGTRAAVNIYEDLLGDSQTLTTLGTEYSSSGYTLSIARPILGSSYSLTYPTTGGFFAVSVNSTASNAAGNITITNVPTASLALSASWTQTPTLQQVTAVGNTTTGSITFLGSGGGLTKQDVTIVGGNSSGTPQLAQINIFGITEGHRMLANKTEFNIDPFGPNHTLSIVRPTLTNSYTLTYPTTGGFFAVSVNSTASNAAGNITITTIPTASFVTASNTHGPHGSNSVLSSSFAISASWAPSVATNTGSLLTTASVSLNTITFTKGDGSTFPITVNTGSGGSVTPTLQQATTAGATTSASFFLTDASNNTIIGIDQYQAGPPTGRVASLKLRTNFTTAGIDVEPVSIRWYSQGSTFTSSFSVLGITQNNFISLPNTSSAILAGSVRVNGTTYFATTGGLVDIGTIGGTPAPSDTFIQYNSGSVFGADSSFRFIYASQSLQQGFNVIASGIFSHAEGAGTQAIGYGSHAEGANTQALDGYSHAEGTYSIAFAEGSHAEGFSTISSGSWSHAEGDQTISFGQYSHAEGFSTVASGSYSHAEGVYTVAVGQSSHAEGGNTQAIGEGSHAEGYDTQAIGNYSHAEGEAVQAIGDRSHAEGQSTKTGTQNAYYAESVVSGVITLSGSYGDVSGQFGADNRLYLYDVPFDDNYGKEIFIISQSYFDSNNTIVELYDTSVNTTTAYVGDLGQGVNNWTGDQTIPGDYSHAEGQSTQAIGNRSHAEGASAQAIGNYSHAEGEAVQAIGGASHAEGYQTQAIGQYSHAEGASAQAIGNWSHAEGWYTISSGSYSHAEGLFAIASGSHSHAEGVYTVAVGQSSHAEGESTQAIGNSSHAEGYQTKTGTQNAYSASVVNGVVTLSGSYGDVTNQFGINNKLYIYDLPFDNTAGGYYEISQSYFDSNNTIIELYNTSANTITAYVGDTQNVTVWSGDQTIGGVYSHAEGAGTEAIGPSSHAEGDNTIAVAYASHAEGSSTEAIGYISHAEGVATKAIGSHSHAEGQSTQAIGYASHAEGASTQAIGYASHTEGDQTIAAGNYQHVQGQFNQTSSIQSAFIVGNGTNNSNRSNLIFAAGNTVQITGSLDVSGSGRFTNGLTVTSSLYVTGSEPTIFSATGDIFEVSGSLVVYGSASISDSVILDGPVDIRNNTRITGSLNITGSATITDVLTLPYQNPLPSSPATGSIALSGSGATFVGMFVWTGAWTQI